MNKKDTQGIALFILRVTLGLFLLLWSIDKLVAPESTIKIFSHFYFVPIGIEAAYVLGSLEALLSILIILGAFKKYTYGLGMLIHGFSTLSTFKQLADPFGKNHLFIAAIPVLGGFIALWLLSDKDTKWAVTKQ